MKRKEEGEDGYKRGGYHPVEIGEVYHDKYSVESKLGWGHFSTVWKSRDGDNDRMVALKVVKSAVHYTEAALDEIEILKILYRQKGKGKHHIITLLDHFYHRGPNGTHICMVFEPLQMSLLDLIKSYHYKGIPLVKVKRITKQILLGLDFIHSQCRVIHTDLKPENILIAGESYAFNEYLPVYKNATPAPLKRTKRRSYEDPLVKIVDFGSACFIHRHYTNDIQTRQYRSIETILGSNYSTPVDMWSLGCIVFELATGDLLFEPQPGDHYDKSDDHLAQFIETLGPIPKRVALSGTKSSHFFKSDGTLRRITKFHFWSLKDVLIRKYKWQAEEADQMAKFILPLLDYDPLRRATAREYIRHPWLSTDTEEV